MSSAPLSGLLETSEIDDAIRKLRRVFGANNDQELAGFLGLKPNAISAWRRRKSIPAKYVLKIIDVLPPFSELNPALNERKIQSMALCFVAFCVERLHDKFGPVHTTGQTVGSHLWIGYKLYRAYLYALRAFRACSSVEAEVLEKALNDLQEGLRGADLMDWFETLPPS